MNSQPLPDTWRSEAFAEDLSCFDPNPAPAGSRWRSRLTTVLLGVVPVMLATVGAALATWISV